MDLTDEKTRFEADLDAEREKWSQGLREEVPEAMLTNAMVLAGVHLLSPHNFIEGVLVAFLAGAAARQTIAGRRRP